MAVTHAHVSVAATATVVAAPTTEYHGARDRVGVSIQNIGAATVYLGGSDVTTTSYGYQLAAGASMSIDLEYGDTLYGVVAAGTNVVAVLKAQV
jgi:hypothetical protein